MPSTEAGKRLCADGSYHAMECWTSGVIEPCDCGLAEAVDAIEAEARAKGRLHALLADEGDIEEVAAGAVLAERARLRGRVEGLLAARGGRCQRVGDVCAAHGEMWFRTGCEDERPDLIAVLAILEEK